MLGFGQGDGWVFCEVYRVFYFYFLFIWFIMKEDGNFGEMGMRMPERKSSAGHVIL